MLARMLMEQAESALADSPGGLGRDLYDRLVAAAQVWATLSTRPTDLEPVTSVLNVANAPRLYIGAHVVLAHHAATSGTLVLDGDGLGTITAYLGELVNDLGGLWEVRWHDLAEAHNHPAASLVAVGLP